jgi:cholest-4-en-3-one 26-monooxygenase
MDPSTINLFDVDAFATDAPQEWFAWLRENAPVYRHAEPGYKGFWVITKHEDVVAVNRNTETFSSAQENGGVVPFEEELIRGVNSMLGSVPLLLTTDPPDHTRYRRLVNRGFTPRALGLVESRLREIANGLVSDALSQGSCDWVETVSKWMPLTTITELVGVPEADRDLVCDFANRQTSSTDPDYGGGDGDVGIESQIAAGMEFIAYAQRLVAERRAEPQAGILSTLLSADIDGEELSEMEIILFFTLLLTAGSETTRNAISHAMVQFAKQPEAYQELVDDPSLLPTAIEEILRWSSPVLYMRRTATKDTVVRGQEILAGDKVTIWYESANRDPEVFADPYTFNIHRDPNPHVTFGGGGPHFCLGASLARLELKVLFEDMFQQVESFRLLGEPTRLRSNMVNGIKALPVELVPRG